MTTGSAVILYRECAEPTSQGVNAQTDDYPCQMGFKQSLYQQCDPTFCDNLEGRGAKSIKALNHKDTKKLFFTEQNSGMFRKTLCLCGSVLF